MKHLSKFQSPIGETPSETPNHHSVLLQGQHSSFNPLSGKPPLKPARQTAEKAKRSRRFNPLSGKPPLKLDYLARKMLDMAKVSIPYRGNPL